MTTALLGTLGTSDVKLQGQTVTADISEAVSDIRADRTIDGASTITVEVSDPHRTLVGTKVFNQRTVLSIDGLHFSLVAVTKAGNLLSVTFEDAQVAALRRTKGQLVAATGTTTRSQFAERIARQTPGVTIVTYPKSSTNREPLSRGTSADPHEDSWTALTRLANEVQWRCCCDGTRILFGPDSWLLSLPVVATVKEHTGGIDDIDFSYDVAKKQTSVTVHATASVWAFPPAAPVKVASLGLATGTWLVNQISRSLFTPNATVTLKGPTPGLPEPVAATSTAGGTVTDATGSASATGGAALAAAKSQIGVPYQWGGESPGKDFDCSGLTQFAYAQAGVTIPRTAQEQYNAGPAVTGGLLPGDLVFFGAGPTSVDHVGIYIGGGQMIDAPHTGATVRVDNIAGFTPGYVGATRP